MQSEPALLVCRLWHFAMINQEGDRPRPTSTQCKSKGLVARDLLPGLKQLAPRELHKRAGLGYKFLVGSHLYDLASDQHDDPVRIADRTEPMRDHPPRNGEPLKGAGN